MTLQALNAMNFQITPKSNYLRADLFDYGTVEEIRRFLYALVEECQNYQCARVVIHVRSSPEAAFGAERYGILAYFSMLASDPSHKIAILGDTSGLGISSAYLQTLVDRHDINVRSFPDEATALQWVSERRQESERRQRPKSQGRSEQRQHQRRQGEPTPQLLH
jgi:hypothetical protein